MIEDSTVINSN